MRNLLVIALFLAASGLFIQTQAHAFAAPPPLWQDNFGQELTELTGEDDDQEMVALPFPFPFNGNTYNTAYVGTNGCIQFDGLGLDNEIDYDHWSYMEEFLADSDPDNPEFCPFNTDLTLEDIGFIFYNNTSDPLVFTWDGVGAIDNTEEPSTFQILLYRDGSIVFNYNSILPGGDILSDFENGIVIGITPSDFVWNDEPFVPGDPGPNDLNAPTTFYNRATIYERWCDDVANSCGTDGNDTGLPGPPNDEFDLDFQSVCFSPEDGGFEVSSAGAENQDFICTEIQARPIPTLSEWGLIAMAGILGIAGLMVLRRRKLAA